MPTAAGIVLLSGVLSYLICSIPFAWLYGLAWGVDIRKEGSKNIGGTNLVRSLGLKGLPGMSLDVFKGIMAIMLTKSLIQYSLNQPATKQIMFMILLACALGHMFPIFLGFKGGKSIAVTGGCLLAIDPKVGLVVIAVWFVICLFSDMVSLGSVVSAVLFPGLILLFYGFDPVIFAVSIAVMFLVIWGHRSNLIRIKQGNEKRLGFIFKGGMWIVRLILSRKGAKIEGLSNIPSKGGYLIVANHLRNSDPFLIGSSTKQPVIFMAKKELWRDPFTAYLMWLTQALKTDRGNVGRDTLDKAVQSIKDGRVLAIFPEEHRNRAPEKGLLEMKPGAAFIATLAGADVLPVAISYPNGKVKIVFGELISNPDNLDKEVRKAVLTKYGVRKSRDALHANIVERLTEMTRGVVEVPGVGKTA